MLMYFSNQHSLTKVERQVYTGTPSKSTYTTVSNLTGTIYMRTLNEELAALNGLQWGQAYSGIVDVSLDLRIADRLTVDGVVYLVKGMVDNTRGTLCDFKKVLLTKPQL